MCAPDGASEYNPNINPDCTFAGTMCNGQGNLVPSTGDPWQDVANVAKRIGPDVYYCVDAGLTFAAWTAPGALTGPGYVAAVGGACISAVITTEATR
jgi:hypothetical protein